MTMTRTKSHSGNCWIEEIKNKKKKTPDAVRGVTEDNPLTPFNKGDLYNVLDFYYRQSWNKGFRKILGVATRI